GFPDYLVCDASIPLGGASLVAGQGARPALRWTAVIGGLGGLEEGHYAAYIKGTPGEFMTDEDVAVFNGMKQAVSDHLGSTVEALILSDVTDLANINNYFIFTSPDAICYSIQIFTSPNSDGLYLLFCHFSAVYNLQLFLDGFYLQVVCIYNVIILYF
ncbi:hypothetical protein ACJX0J_019624, partial [Zea mays]